MANPCLQLSGFLLSCLGWLCVMIAISTNDWVNMCKYGLNTCKKMDELGAKGPWADCVISTGLYHCVSLTQILDLPAYIQTTRALMVTGSILGLPAVGMLLMSMPCISLSESQTSKNRRTVLGGVMMLVVGLCALVSTVWFPIGAYQEHGLMSFGFSLYVGWVGTIFCLLGGSILTCCSSSSSSSSHSHQDNNRFYYSKQGGANPPAVPSSNHAKSAHV
ncbi:claudin-11a [Brachionichthys hirsutus]|uniref:claudin-11a n=1 Tax=Brachionichthys hirsutus TaxID=412623 RepID=UPI0036050F61